LIQRLFAPERWINYEGAHAELAREDLGRIAAECEGMLDENADLSLSDLVTRLRIRIATREPLGRREEPDVRIVTLWGAKGLTADYVYIVGLVDQALPGPHDPAKTGLTDAEHLAEQRRLLYVSLTRAKKGLVLSRPRQISRGDALSLGLAVVPGWTQLLRRPRFLGDLPAGAVPAAVSGDEWEGLAL
jgi:superfamily I DNA/RNA helicase